MMCKTVSFDLNGALLNSTCSVYLSPQYAMRVTNDSAADVRHFMGYPADKHIAVAVWPLLRNCGSSLKLLYITLQKRQISDDNSGSICHCHAFYG